MFAAEAAILLHFEPVRIILFVLLCVIVSLLALAAHQSNLDSCVIGHLFFGTSLINLPERFTSGVRTSLRAQFLGAGKLKKSPDHRGRVIIPLIYPRVKAFFHIILTIAFYPPDFAEGIPFSCMA